MKSTRNGVGPTAGAIARHCSVFEPSSPTPGYASKVWRKGKVHVFYQMVGKTSRAGEIGAQWRLLFTVLSYFTIRAERAARAGGMKPPKSGVPPDAIVREQSILGLDERQFHEHLESTPLCHRVGMSSRYRLAKVQTVAVPVWPSLLCWGCWLVLLAGVLRSFAVQGAAQA